MRLGLHYGGSIRRGFEHSFGGNPRRRLRRQFLLVTELHSVTHSSSKLRFATVATTKRSQEFKGMLDRTDWDCKSPACPSPELGNTKRAAIFRARVARPWLRPTRLRNPAPSGCFSAVCSEFLREDAGTVGTERGDWQVGADQGASIMPESGNPFRSRS